MSELVRACPSAEFSCSMGLTREEFLEVAFVYTKRPLSRHLSGATEISDVGFAKRTAKFSSACGSESTVIYAACGRRGVHCEVKALSPADGELTRFLAGIVAHLPSAILPTTKFRLPDPEENDLSVAWVSIGDVQILLGADILRNTEWRGEGGLRCSHPVAHLMQHPCSRLRTMVLITDTMMEFGRTC